MSDEREFKDLPEGWKWVRLGEVIEDIADGGTPSRDNPEYFNGNINWLVVDDIQRKIIKTKETITAEGLKHSNAKLWKKGTVILSFGATIGEVGIAEIELATKQGIAGIVPQKDKLLNTFLYYVLKHNKHILLRYANQTTIMEVRPSVIKEKFKLPLPPLPEQQKIAEILETIDNAIEKTDKIIEKYKRIKQGLMQDLLTKGIDENGNIRSEKTHKFKDSPLGRIPEEWGVVKVISGIGENPSLIVAGPFGSNLKVEDYKETGIPILRLQNIDENKFIEKDIKFISEKKAKELSYHSFKGGDIALAKLGEPVGKTCLIPERYKYGIVVADVVRIRVNPEFANKMFISYILNYNICRKQLNTDIIGTTRPRVNLTQVRDILILFPPLPEQQKIASILSNIDETIEKEQQYKEKLERIKQGLMEDLLTGKVRVNHLIKEGENYVSQA